MNEILAPAQALPVASGKKALRKSAPQPQRCQRLRSNLVQGEWRQLAMAHPSGQRLGVLLQKLVKNFFLRSLITTKHNLTWSVARWADEGSPTFCYTMHRMLSFERVRMSVEHWGSDLLGFMLHPNEL